MTIFNLSDQLVFYGSYHHNRINQFIHIVFVPTILWTAYVWLAYTPQLIDKSHNPVYQSLTNNLPHNPFTHFITNNFILNATFFIWAIYSIYYVIIAGLVGFFMDIFTFILLLLANYYVSVDPSNAWKVALVLHIFSWYMQIHPGHLMFEQRKPALTDSFFQSLVLAPLFVFYEVLFMLGMQQKIYKEIEPRILQNIKQYKAGKKLQ